MLSQTETALPVIDRSLAHLHPMIVQVIMAPSTNSDRGALRVVLSIVGKTPAHKRARVWDHFERKIKPRLRSHVIELHRCFDLIAAEEDAKAAEFEQFVAAARSGRRSKSVDGRSASDGQHSS